jgi:hypothetical protein
VTKLSPISIKGLEKATRWEVNDSQSKFIK